MMACLPAGLHSLEVDTSRELHDARISREAGDGAYAATAGVAAGLAEDGMVDEVEDFPAEFCVQILVDGNLLDEVEVEELGFRADERVAAHVADDVLAGIGVGGGEAGAELGAVAVGRVVEPALLVL